MKKYLSIILACLFAQQAWTQSGEGYNPENPADPDVYYTLTLEASPRSGGTVNSNDHQKLSAGQSTYVNASPRLGYEFKRWMIGDSVASTNSGFSFTMPEKDVVLTAYFEWNPEYNPQNPDDPDAEGYSHHVYVYATPSVGGYFNSSSFTLVEGKTTNIYAYPREGYSFESWVCNGEVVSTDNPLSIKMGTADIAYTATFVYSPVSPGEPSPNVFNTATGEVVIDNFTQGSLNSAISTAVGSSENYAQVQSIMVVGRLAASDFGFYRNYTHCSLIDLSRTTGYTEIPSWSFEGAEALKSLHLPLNVEKIGENAFKGCTALKHIYLYATMPPVLEEGALEGLDKKVTLHVPSASVALYTAAEGWNKLNIQSLDENEKSITVTLSGAAGEYKNMTLELQNMQSGQVYRCLVTDRMSYTFFGLMKNTYYNLYLKNSNGTVLGEINNVALENDNLNVSFEKVKTTHAVTLNVVTPDGKDVTADVTITWLDELGSYLRQGNKLNELLIGTNIQYRVKLSEELAVEYVQPVDVAYQVMNGENSIVLTLSPIKRIAMSGYVKDAATKQGIYSATVSISQTLNGKYSKTIIAKTDNRGYYTANVYNAPTSLAISAYDYVNQTAEIAIDPSAENVTVDDIAMTSIIGATINLSLTYTPSVAEGETAETQTGYDDYKNVVYNIYNLTTGQEVNQVSVRYPQLVILDGAKVGDKLKITAVSKRKAFENVDAEIEIGSEGIAEVSLPIVEYGGLKATYYSKKNDLVVGMLYNQKGYLIKSYDYSVDADITINGLEDGNYSLVSMGKNSSYNSIYFLPRLKEILVAEDYTIVELSIRSGVVSKIQVASIPFFDEEKYKYIDNQRSLFKVDNLSVEVGNYLTFYSSIVAKDVNISKLKDLTYHVDFPPSVVFVDKSVMLGDSIINSYQFEGNTLTINCHEFPQGKIKFCAIPTVQGSYSPSASVSFVVDDKEYKIPIESAKFEAKNLSLYVQDLVADSMVYISGTAPKGAKVLIYDDDIQIGQTVTDPNGRWSLRTGLYKPYSHSFHDIYAEAFADEYKLISETKTVEYDKNGSQLVSITMLYNGNTIVFNQIEGTTSASTYSYVPSVTDFTFIAQFTKNDTSLIKNLEFKVLASDGTVRRVSSTFSEKHNAWVGKATYDNSSKIPVNVSTDFYTIKSIGQIDNMRIHSDWIDFKEMILSNVTNIDTVKSKIIDITDSMVIYQYQTTNMDTPVYMKVAEIAYSDWIDELEMRDYIIVEKNGRIICMIDSIMESNYIAWFWMKNDTIMMMIEFSENLSFSGEMIRCNSPRRASTWWGNIIDGFCPLNICGIIDIINQYNRGYEEYQHWLRQYNVTLNEHYNLYLKTKELLNARCKDGSLKLQSSIYDLFCEFLNYDYENANWMHKDFKRNLNTMGRNLDERRNLASALGAFGSLVSLLGGAAYNLTELGSALLGTATNFAGWGMNEFLDNLEDWFTDEKMTAWFYPENQKVVDGYIQTQNSIIKAYRKCPEKEEKEEEKKDDDFNNKNLKPTVDPSGYVYEGVSSNRLQGVTATAYYMETTEDMYGVLHDEPKVWNAEEYAQENPLFTDENGMYQWFVPQGLWQVKFEKEGYETSYSEWLPVPPPQLEVNIGMVQSRQPEVKQTHAYKDGIEVEFDKYMLPALLNTNNILVSQHGQYVEGEVKLLNEETAYSDKSTKYVSKIRFVPTTPFTASEVTLTVANRVKSYAGLQMQDSYQQTFDIEKEVKSLVVDSVTNVPYTGKKEIAVYVLPADAAEGKKMRASSAAELIASLEQNEVVIDENGLAQFIVNGELPGSTGITFCVEGLDVSATTMAKVEKEKESVPVIVPMPTASIAAGSSVYRGTEVILNVEADGLKIWYTTDGSCPCDENGTRQVYSDPIAITGDMVIKAMTETTEGDGSDVATFTYSILRNNDGIELNNGWTWTSFNMASDALVNVNTALASGAWTVNDEIKDDRYTDSYSANQRKWIGTLSKHGKLDNTGMFKIHSSQAQTLQLTGEAINPQTVSITVNPNWNYIAYLPMRNLSLAEALAGYAAQEGDVIKSQDAFAVYSASTGWQGDLTTMIVGQGYMLKRSASAAKTTFRYPEGTTGTRAKKRLTKSHAYADNMNVIGRVMDIDTEKGDSLIAMVDGKVRGASVVQEHGRVFLTIQGDETENVELVLQRDGEQIAVANAPIRYENNDVLGTLDVPTDIKFATANNETEGIKVSPCIVETSMTVSVNREDIKNVSVTVHGTNGTMVAEAHQNGVSGGRFEKTFNLSSLPSGVYLVTVHVNGQSNVVRIIKK